jgi:AraC family transcriptional regulator of adaptative response/methylated-DNA-[protein]-cysteine methyltransferase
MVDRSDDARRHRPGCPGDDTHPVADAAPPQGAAAPATSAASAAPVDRAAAGSSAGSPYAIVQRAIAHIRRHALRQPSLQEVADAVGLSPHHLQRVFTAWAGVSPKRFLQALTVDDVKKRLREGADVLSAADAVGLGSGSRVHDLMVSCEAVTPGEYKSGGRGLALDWGVGSTPFGQALTAWTGRGLCHLVFLEDIDAACVAVASGEVDVDADAREAAALAGLRRNWPQALLQRDDEVARQRLQSIFARVHGAPPERLLLRGTNFQIQVWRALLATRPGEVLSYTALARRAGVAGAARAVGGAMAANTLAVLIPCHRVLREDGDVGHYRWGVPRKLALLGWEAARAEG